MGQQSIGQEAHRAALVPSSRRRKGAERAKLLLDMAGRVPVALRERGATVADAELRAGQALREMTGRRVCR
jgi:hypothetical protein